VYDDRNLGVVVVLLALFYSIMLLATDFVNRLPFPVWTRQFYPQLALLFMMFSGSFYFLSVF
jgi:hypothetical protein